MGNDLGEVVPEENGKCSPDPLSLPSDLLSRSPLEKRRWRCGPHLREPSASPPPISLRNIVAGKRKGNLTGFLPNDPNIRSSNPPHVHPPDAWEGDSGRTQVTHKVNNQKKLDSSVSPISVQLMCKSIHQQQALFPDKLPNGKKSNS
ncbi:hypothetical protein CDAR_548871 [Caerostris darwini]|uniref:Prolactin receptor n=1 Tax=Caerostris darwini TaxID=1538125 RepID=A0AAV4WIY7_9ARAC|nr:hypothetical protein CDAR_548871 [Caerostris darwini]